MNQVAWLYFVAILTGFSLIVLTTVASSFVNPISTVLVAIGAITVILFSIAILYLALKELLSNF